jgi:DUF971 family protein
MTDAQTKAWPSELRVKDQGALLAVNFDQGGTFELPAEFLRVESPSAEVKGHGPGQETTVGGKRNVKILSVEPVGNYAVRITFSDGHASGIYSWDYLHKLGTTYDDIWSAYLQKLKAKGLERS